MSFPNNDGLTIILIAKEPVPGKVKTRLHPVYSYQEAADLASRFIQASIHTINGLPAGRRILYYDGDQLPSNVEGWEIIPQCSGELDERLGHIFDICEGPTLLLGMDTPQMSYLNLEPVFSAWSPGVDGFMGPANDGGYWALALANPKGDLIRGVPMSQDSTGTEQLKKLATAGLTIQLLDELVDVDTPEDLKMLPKILVFD